MSAYSSLLRPLLFRLPGEVAHAAGKATLRHELPWRWLAKQVRFDDPRLATRLGGLALANPIGLSAGFDKNVQAMPGLQQLGFGYITVGSILPTVRSGNPKPRLIRYPETQSMLNCYGLPSQGLDACVARLRALKASRRIPIVANIDAPSIELYLRSFAAVEPLADAVQIGIQCPNNRDDRGEFHEPASFERMLGEVMQRRRKPVFIKLLNYENELEKQSRLELVERAVRLGVDAVDIPGIWKIPEPRLSLGIGATSGRMCFERTLATVRDVYAVTRGRTGIIASGGIFTGEEAFQVLAAGADTVDILTAFIYRGWTAAAEINRELLAQLDRHRVPDLRRLRGFAKAA